MADEIQLRMAVDTAWSVYRETHRGIDVADNRRCLLERHLYRRWEARNGDLEDLACSGLAYLERLPEDE